MLHWRPPLSEPFLLNLGAPVRHSNSVFPGVREPVLVKSAPDCDCYRRGRVHGCQPVNGRAASKC